MRRILYLILGLVVLFGLTVPLTNPVLADSSGPRNGSAFANDTTVGTIDWTDPGYAVTSNNSRAMATLAASQVTHYLKATGFGFSIPLNATIKGIRVDVERRDRNSTGGSTGTRSIYDNSVRLVKNGTIAGSDLSSSTLWPSGDTYISYGGVGELWGQTWTAADINNAATGFVISARNTSTTTTRQAQIDHIRMTVYYSVPPCSSSTLRVQLAIILDGSTSITQSNPNNFINMKNGLADAIENASPGCFVHDGSIELTVVQIGLPTGSDPGGVGAAVEVPPTVITASNAATVATTVRNITQRTGYTPLACAFYLAADTLYLSPCFSPSHKQVINLVTDGIPTRCCNNLANPYNSIGCDSCSTSGCTDAINSTVAARNYTISLLGMTTDQDEIDAEFIGVQNENLDPLIGASRWLRTAVVWPQPGSYATPPPYPPAGWVQVIADGTEYADAICAKLVQVSCTDPVAIFSGTPTTVCQGETVTFTDASTPVGDIDSWSWTFEGGTPTSDTTQTPPAITYNTPGTYYVTLIATNACGSDNETKPLYITVNPVPDASASGTTTVCVGGTIQLVGGPDGMNSYSWTGPNGFNSTEQSPSIPNASMDMAGTYTLTVTNDCGSDDATVPVSVIQCGGGGGGDLGLLVAPRCPLTLTVNMLGKITKARMTSDGILCEDCLALDPPKQNSWEAKAGTRLTLEDNKVPELIKVTLAGSSPPSGATETIGPTYELNAYASINSLITSPISISPLFSMSSAYDPNKLPKNISGVFLAYYPEPSQGWLAMGSEGIVAEIGKARGTLNYFAPATILAKLAEITQAKFQAINLTISPSQIQLNQEVTISLNVANTGGTSGDYSVELKVNGISKSTKQVTLAAGTSQTVSFTITGDAAGKHQVEVAGLEGQFVVVGPSEINWWLIAAIIGIILVLVIGLIVWRRRLRS